MPRRVSNVRSARVKQGSIPDEEDGWDIIDDAGEGGFS